LIIQKFGNLENERSIHHLHSFVGCARISVCHHRPSSSPFVRHHTANHENENENHSKSRKRKSRKSQQIQFTQQIRRFGKSLDAPTLKTSGREMGFESEAKDKDKEVEEAEEDGL